MKRAKHSLSHYKLMTGDMGKLYPVGMYEVLPGDTCQQNSSALIRVSPMLAPVMHPVVVRIHHWYVPYRLLWDEWEDFITGGADGEGDGAVFPYITAHAVNGFTAKTLPDFFGVPPGSDHPGLQISALPIRAYNSIFNEYYRDQDIVTALTVPTAGGADSTSPLVVQDVAWEKDYFTAARPWPQKGPEVTLPLGTSAPLVNSGTGIPTFNVGAVSNAQLQFGVGNPGPGSVAVNIATGSTATWDDPALVADLSAATAVDVNTVRLAFAVQRYQEARAQYGSRFTEYLRYLGVHASDSRLQRPEYLGGGKQVISFSEVLQTGVTTDGDDQEGVGNLKGHGIAAMRSRSYRRFFEEHGVVVSLMSVRPRSMYVNGLHRSWSKRTKEEYWQKELELIGQQEVYSRELFAESDANGGNAVFGYQDRYSEYRSMPSTVAGEFRSTLNYWHLARIFASPPTLNQSFTDCDPSKRIHAVTSADVLWCMVSHSIQARRLVQRHGGVGRII